MIRYYLFLIFISTQICISQNNFIGGWTVTNPFEQKNFIKNEGQCDFGIDNSDYKVFFEACSQGIHYFLCDKGIIIWKYKNPKKNDDEKSAREEKERENIKIEREKIIDTIQFKDANLNIEILLGEKVSNYYVFSSKNGKGDIKASAYKTVTFKNLYNYIDLLFEFKPDTEGIKYSFILHPQANVDDIKLVFSKKLDIHKNQLGDLIVNSPVETFIHHAPNSFVQNNNKVIPSSYILNNNIIQFKIPNQKENETIIIDPWIISAVNLTGNNGAFDIDYDNNGNVFIYGGSNHYTINKYDKFGTLLWTTLPFISDYAYMYGDFAIDRFTGNAYIVQGLFGFGAKIKKLNPFGLSLASFPGINTAVEMWRITFDPCTNKGIIGGGGDSPFQIAYLDTTLATVNPINYLGSHNDIASIAIDDYGFCYQIVAGINKIIKLPISNLSSTIYQVPTGYNTAEYDSNFFYDPNSDYSPAYNGIAISDKMLYTTDGYDVKKWNTNTGLLLNSKNIASSPDGNQTHKYWSGIASNNCDQILVSNNDKILLLDGGLNILKTIAMPNTVYDIMIQNKNVYVSGKNFVNTFSLNELTCPNVIANITQPDSCRGLGTATLSITGGISPYSINWSTMPAQNTNTVSGLLAGATYYYSVEDNSCPKNKKDDSITVFNPSKTILSINIDSVSCQKLNDGKISVSCSGGEYPYNYNWSSGQSGINANNLENLNSGFYTLTVTDNKGCKNSVVVEVPYSMDFKFNEFDKVNVFTPNNDGLNDSFFPLTNFKHDFNTMLSIMNNYDLSIYNRWGLQVYHTNNPFAFWDGKISNSSDINEGTYFWVLKIKSDCLNSKEEMIKGFVQLFK